MATATLHHALGSLPIHTSNRNTKYETRMSKFSARMVYKGVAFDLPLVSRGNRCFGSWKLDAIHASTSNSSVVDPAQLPSNGTSSESRKKSSMVNCKVSTSKKLPIDLGMGKFMNGAVVMISLHRMVRVWRCVQKELLLILESKLNLSF